MSQPHSQLNSDVLRAWCDAPGHFLPPEPPTAASATDNARSRDSSPQRHRYTPAEISQYSVDLLLREYYKIVTSQQRSGHTGRMYKQSEEGGLVQRAFLLLCPTPPACLELDHIVKATAWLVALSARALTLSACLLVPALLAFIRRVQTEQGQAAAALLTFGAVLLLLVADTISRRAQQKQQQAQAACVTAANLQQQLQAAGAGSNELATLRAASKTATTSNSSRHSASAPRTQQPAAAAAAGGGGSRPGSIDGSGAAATACAALEAELAALQAALGVSVSSRHDLGTRQHVADVLTQLSEQLGVQAPPDVTASPAAMAAAVAQLKQSVGI